jgi:hypothetical protein
MPTQNIIYFIQPIIHPILIEKKEKKTIMSQIT